MKDENNSLPEGVFKSIEIQNKIKDSIPTMTQYYDQTKKSYDPYLRIPESLRTSIISCNPAIEAIKQSFDSSVFENLTLQISTPALDIANQINLSLAASLSESLKGILESFTPMVNMIRTPALDWFRSFDISPFTQVLKNLQIDSEISHRYKELNEIYLQTMYETKWCPYARWIADTSLFGEVNYIIRTSRGASKNREKRIDKAILSYYTKSKILQIKKSWWKTDLDYCIRRTLLQAIDSYLRGEYALTIPCLSTMWEGLIYIKAKNVSPTERERQSMKETKNDLKALVENDNYEIIFCDYFDNWIVSNCNGVKDVVEGVPNRHGVAHSWYRQYPNKKAALNAILMTDFIVSLSPITKSGEK